MVEFTKEVIQDKEDNFSYLSYLINQLDDEKYHEVFYLRYFEFLPVTERTYYCVRVGHTGRLINAAIKELERIEANDPRLSNMGADFPSGKSADVGGYER